MGYLEKLEDINLPIVLLLLQLVSYPFVIGIRDHVDPVGNVISALLIIIPVFGTLFSLVLTQGHVALGVLYLLILMQFSFVVALYNVIGQQEVITW